MGYDPSKTTWFNPNIEYLFNDEIIEYDMKDAGFNLIKQFKLLPPAKIAELESMGKGIERHIAVGKLQANDKVFSKALLDKFAEMRAIFIGMNKLDDNRIISVKKDALFIIGECNKTKFGSIEFSDKNHYTSYIRFPSISNLEIYYNKDNVEVKGMSELSVNKHRIFMLDFIMNVIELMENKSLRARRYILDFIMKYKNHELDEEYYVEFNNMSRNYNILYNYQNIIIPLLQIIIKEIT